MAIKPKTRYAVLRRDDFKCAYCGVRAPDSRLHVDHIIPRAQGGTDDSANLTAACDDCNQGKGASRLSEDRIDQMLGENGSIDHYLTEWRLYVGYDMPDEIAGMLRFLLRTSGDAVSNGFQTFAWEHERRPDRDIGLFWRGFNEHLTSVNQRDAEALLG